VDHRLARVRTQCSGVIEQWYRPPQVDGLGLSTTDRSLLTDIGVPTALGPLFVGRPMLDGLSVGGTVLVRFASEYGADLAIEPSSGHVLSLLHDGGIRYVDTDFARFLLFVCRVRPAWTRWSDLPDTIANAGAAALRQTLRAIDAAAFGSPGHWWSLVFEQFEAGLL
jgi:hypothetical protein